MEEDKKEEVVKTQEVKDENYAKLKKSNNRKKALLIVLLFIIVLMGLVIFIFFTEKKEEPKKEENNQQEQAKEEKKEEKKEEPTPTAQTKLTVYQYEDATYVSTEERSGYINKVEYTCLDKNCKLVNDGSTPWDNNVFNYAIINDNNQTVIIDFETKKVLKTDIVPTDEKYTSGGEVMGYVFAYKNVKYNDLRVFKDESDSNIIYIKLSYQNDKTKIFALVYDLTKDLIVEGRDYPLHDGMEYDFSDSYTKVF